MADRSIKPYLRAATLWTAAFLYFAACVTPALEMKEIIHAVPFSDGTAIAEKVNLKTLPGYLIAFTGWVAVMLFGSTLAWLANGTAVVGLILLAKRYWRSALVFSTLSLLLAADTVRPILQATDYSLRRPEIWDLVIVRPLLGCYLWFGSMVVLFAGALWCWQDARRAALASDAGEAQASSASRSLGTEPHSTVLHKAGD